MRLLGGRTLSAFQPVTEPAVLNRLQEKARAGVRQIDLRALGIHEFGEMKSRGFGRAATPAHCELFCDGWDQASFDPAYRSYPLAHFEPLVRRIFLRKPFDPAVMKASGRIEDY